MSNGTNWMGGRGKKAKSGLKILERGANPEQHFAKLRAVTRNLIVNDPPNGGKISQLTPIVSLKHAQSDSQGPIPVHAAARTEDDFIHLSTSVLPRVLDRPNKPTKQNRLPKLMETAVRNIESLDAKRAHINSIDTKSLVGLDIASRKRKFGMALDGQGQTTSKPFYYPFEAKPRAFTTSPSPEPPIVVDTCAEHIEDMLSFGTPSDRQSTNGTPTPNVHSSGEIRDEQIANRSRAIADTPPLSTTPVGSQSSTKEIEIPPNLYENAFRVAAQTLKLQDALLGVQTNTSLAPWHTRPNKDDSEVRAFNLFTSTQVDVLDGTPLDPNPRTEMSFREERNLLNELSGAMVKENRLGIGNQTRSSLGQDQQGQTEDKALNDPVMPHVNSRVETPKGTKPPPLPPKKPTRKAQSNLGRGSMPPSPLDRYVFRSRPSHSRRTYGQVAHSNNHRGPDDRELMVIAESVPRLDNARVTLDFASLESSPSPSQGFGVSLTTRHDSRVIVLPLFDDRPQTDVDAEVDA
ncbi:unnamed protein product [Rhizoctonia solani]|uniref:Uncharacterized protein n=1 Tax=Rhizoctonia solani TaxID=456999 RepID=A0A8H3GIH9_9AGAM|nr:unnamed protein product [Rhizoctonia solani]